MLINNFEMWFHAGKIIPKKLIVAVHKQLPNSISSSLEPTMSIL